MGKRELHAGGLPQQQWQHTAGTGKVGCCGLLRQPQVSRRFVDLPQCKPPNRAPDPPSTTPSTVASLSSFPLRDEGVYAAAASTATATAERTCSALCRVDREGVGRGGEGKGGEGVTPARLFVSISESQSRRWQSKLRAERSVEKKKKKKKKRRCRAGE